MAVVSTRGRFPQAPVVVKIAHPNFRFRTVGAGGGRLPQPHRRLAAVQSTQTQALALFHQKGRVGLRDFVAGFRQSEVVAQTGGRVALRVLPVGPPAPRGPLRRRLVDDPPVVLSGLVAVLRDGRVQLLLLFSRAGRRRSRWLGDLHAVFVEQRQPVVGQQVVLAGGRGQIRQNALVLGHGGVVLHRIIVLSFFGHHGGKDVWHHHRLSIFLQILPPAKVRLPPQFHHGQVVGGVGVALIAGQLKKVLRPRPVDFEHLGHAPQSQQPHAVQTGVVAQKHLFGRTARGTTLLLLSLLLPLEPLLAAARDTFPDCRWRVRCERGGAP